MKEEKRVLVLGHGIMGSFLVPELSRLGFLVDVVCLEDRVSQDPRVRFFRADAKSPTYMQALLEKTHYHAVVDFLLYTIPEFQQFHGIFLSHTEHYIFLSSYRVYSALEIPIRETSPQMLDVSQDREYLSHDDEYSLYKAKQERILRASGCGNFTIVRPSIVYSRLRFQLGNLEAPVFMTRSWQGKPVVLPQQLLDVPATMTWGGDAGRMIARLVLQPEAMGQAYSVCTAEHHTWREIAEMYERLFGLRYITVDTDTYLGLYDHSFIAKYTLLYDRCVPRIMDNRKILSATSMRQQELMPLEQGLALEYAALPKGKRWPESPLNQTMDALLGAMNPK